MKMFRAPFRLAMLVLALASLVHADSGSSHPPMAVANDNRIAAGVLQGGVLKVDLDLGEARWAPDEEGGPSLVVYAFSERGQAPQIPGPLLRVAEGTMVEASIRNNLDRTMYAGGLCERPCQEPAMIEVPAGQTRSIRFRAGAAGNYYYWAASFPDDPRTVSFERLPPNGIESQAGGAIVVDGGGLPADDRVLVIGLWWNNLEDFNEVLTVNGKSWPHTERFHFRTGEVARWRVINASLSPHAMHLHGFYFRVDSKGGPFAGEVYSREQQRLAVTERLENGQSMSIAWEPHTPGNWIFHCHMVAHMSAEARLPMHPQYAKAAAGEGAAAHQHDDGSAGMGGLVLGITVTGEPQQPWAERAPRRLKLFVRPRAGTARNLAGASYQLQEGDTEPDPHKVPVVGEPLVLTRNQPVEIEVINQNDEPTVVHWHGIELESYYDGVAGWGGSSKMMTPPIPPGGSFVARMAPPRAGTFIYHSHWHDHFQIRGGMAGALIVVEPGEKFDPQTDKIFLITRQGPSGGAMLSVNGYVQPGVLRLETGQTYRLRFINISPNDVDLLVTLRKGTEPVQWRAVGKDGDSLPPAQAVARPARQFVAVGETYDFELQAAEEGDLILEFYEAFDQKWVFVPVQIRKPAIKVALQD